MKHINELKKTKKLLRIVLPFLAIAGCHTVSSVAMDTVGLQANSFELSPENQPAVFHILSNSMPKRYAVPLWIGKANQALVNTKAIKVSVGHPNHSDQVSLEWCTSRGKRSSYALILNGDAGANRGILREQETKSHRATLNSNETSEIKAWSQQLTREVMSTIHTSLKDACKNGIQWPCLDK